MRPNDESDRPEGRRVPLLDALGIRSIEAGGGRGRVEVVVGENHLRSKGIVHGGLFATLLDTAMGWAADTEAPEGYDLVTAQLNVNFIRPARPGDTLIATGEIQHLGARTAVARGEVRLADGTLTAAGSATFLYVIIAT